MGSSASTNLVAAKLHHQLAAHATANGDDQRAARFYEMATLEYARGGDLTQSEHCEAMASLYSRLAEHVDFESALIGPW